jgi:transposase
MLDEIIITETPPLYCCYGRVGQQVSVPITGGHDRRILHGAINVGTGDVLLAVTKEWNQVTQRGFLSQVRAHWRGWQVVLFEDRAGQHTAPDSLFWADCLGIEVRLLPRATPELNAMDHLWRHAKGHALASRPTASMDASAARTCEYICSLSPRERLRKAGVLSGNFWLAD